MYIGEICPDHNTTQHGTTISNLINQIKKGDIYALEGGQVISESMIISNIDTLLVNTAMFHQDIW